MSRPRLNFCALGATVIIVGWTLAVAQSAEKTAADVSSAVSSRDHWSSIDEAPAPVDPREQALRRAKNKRYDAKGPDLTRNSEEIFVDTYYPRHIIFPDRNTKLAVVAVIEGWQPYLSSNRSYVYTELRVRVEEILLDGSGNHRQGDVAVIDADGGALRLSNGQALHFYSTCPENCPTVGGRYLLYARPIHDGRDLSLSEKFELRDGRVLPPTRHFPWPKGWDDEQTFLSEVRAHVSSGSTR